jgi:NAD(P)-dependent dehydrogenase (short-subunit alcohol dehydrogenase family)
MDSMVDLTEKYGEQLWLAHLDVTDTAEVNQVVNKAFGDLGRIDGVINNAGYGLFGAAEELSDEQIDHQINTNLLGSIQVVRAALPHLRSQGGGRVIQVSTYGGQATNPGATLYNASKWGIEGFMEALSKEVAPFNIASRSSSRAVHAPSSGPEARGSRRLCLRTTARRQALLVASRPHRNPRPAIPPRWPKP